MLGIIPQRLLDREVGKHDLTELRITATMFERKEILIDEADAFVALPGGLGTLDEILDVVTLRQLGYHAKPMLLLDLAGYWRGCQAVFEQFVTAGFADPAAARRPELVPDLPGILDRLRSRRAQRAPPLTAQACTGAPACSTRAPEQRDEVDRVDHQRREAAVAGGIGDDAPREREQQARAFDQQQRLQAVGRNVGQREQAAIGRARPGRPVRRRPWRRR